MNFKRGKPKNSRSGCLFCKPHKANHRPHRVKIKGQNGLHWVRGSRQDEK